MSIANASIYLSHLDTTTHTLLEKYKANKLATIELKKLSQDNKKLADYLNNLDHLKPKYNTDQINEMMKAILLHIDILKVEIAKKDFSKLQHETKIIKTMLKFHPTKYSKLAFITAWFMEWLYFI